MMRYYKRVDQNGDITTVEAYSHSKAIKGAIQINRVEYQTFIDSYPEPETTTPRNVIEELDMIWIKLDELHPESLWNKVKKVFAGN